MLNNVSSHSATAARNSRVARPVMKLVTGFGATITGRAVYVNDVLGLTQEEGPPLAGRIESKDPSKSVFHLMGGGNNAPAPAFIR